jgi:SMODS domain-containing protein
MFIDPRLARRSQLAEILETMCEGLELSRSQAGDAEQRYNTVGHWLGDDPDLVGASIYVHGSVALGTTVKPLARAEYDVDLVCHIPHGSPAASPAELKRLVGDRLKDHGTYVRLLEEMRRCWRLNYAGEFHMDITPSVPNPACPLGGELVPDKELRRWKPTNPIGYRKLFEQRALLEPAFQLMKTEAYRGARDANIEPYPAHMRIKGLLRRAVQLCKRHRDIYFGAQPELAPLSIIITTLAARSYEWCIGNGCSMTKSACWSPCCSRCRNSSALTAMSGRSRTRRRTARILPRNGT